MRKYRVYILASVLTWFANIHSAVAIPALSPEASDKPMTFQLVTLSDEDVRALGPWSEIIQGGNRAVILANGEIVGEGEIKGVPATSETFRAFLASHYIAPGAVMMLSSPGGHLYDSFLIGKQVRQAGLRTTVIPKSMCASACNFVFMGGTVRTLPADSLFVVHRFAPFESQLVDQKKAEEEAQEQSGDISLYLKTMGIDPEFLVLMSQIENAKPQAVPADLLQQLLVLNSGSVTKWAEGSVKGVFYLDAITSKVDNYGYSDHLGLLCDHGKPYLRAVYFPHDTDYVRPMGVAAVDPDPYRMLGNSPLLKSTHEQLDQYPLWDVTTSSLVRLTYGLTLKNFPSSAIDIDKSAARLEESDDHKYVVVVIDLTQDMLNLILNSNGVGFGFLISSSGQVPPNTTLSTAPHANDFSRASVSYHTSIDAEGKARLQSFVDGCGGLK